jgi:hypothetical protein
VAAVGFGWWSPLRRRRLPMVALVVGVGLAVGLAMQRADASVACTKVWTGEDDDQYTNPLNWSPTVVPGPNDYACADDDVVFDAGTKVVRGINFTAGLTIEGGELRVGAGTAADESFVEDLYLASRLGGKSPITVTGSGTLFDGAVIGSPKAATGALGGIVTVAEGARFDIDERLVVEGGRTLRNEGTVNWLFADIVLCDGALIENAASFLVSADGGTVAGCEPAAGSFVNQPGGDLVKQALGTGATISVPFENDGAVLVEDDVLAVGAAPGGTDDSGSIALVGSSSIEMAGDRAFAAASAFSGTGWVRVSAGSATFSAGEPIRNVAMTGGSLRGGPTITNAFEWYGGSLSGVGTTTMARGAYLRVESDASHQLVGGHILRNEGDLGWFSGDIGLCDGSVLDNAGTIRMQSLTARRLYPCGAAGTLRNRDTGSIAKQTGPEALIDVPVVNDGVIDVGTSQVLRLRADVGNLAGRTLTGGSYRVRGSGRLLIDEVIGGIDRLAGSVALDGPTAMIGDAAGNDALPALDQVVAGGHLELSGGRVLDVGALTNEGTVVVGESSRLRVAAAGTAYRQLSGSTTLGGASAELHVVTPGAAVELAGGELTGSGRIVAPVVRDTGAMVRPGQGIGVLSVVGDFEQGPGGRLTIEVDGASGSVADRLSVSGAAHLGGTLDLVTLVPAGPFTVVSASTRTGTFTSVVGAQLADANYQLSYGPTGVSVTTAMLPRVGVGEAIVHEGDTGTRTMLIPVTLDRPATETVVLRYRIVAGTASGRRVDVDDFAGAERTLSFKPIGSLGVTPVSKSIPVKIYGDTAAEGDESFAVEIVGATGAAIGRATGTSTIVDDEAGDTVVRAAMGSVTVIEGDDGVVKMTARVTLSRPATTTSTVVVTPLDLTATAGADVKVLKPKTITFRPGTTQASVTVVVLPNAQVEPDRQLQLSLGSPTNLAITGTGVGLLTILDDD